MLSRQSARQSDMSASRADSEQATTTRSAISRSFCSPPRPSPPESKYALFPLVEDDDDVRSLARCVLEDAGYHVIEAADGHRAIAAWQEFTGRIDLLLTDMVMPGGLSGSDVAQRFSAARPEGKIIFSSGYSESLFGKEAGLRKGVTYLPKPYISKQLTNAVARALADTAVAA